MLDQLKKGLITENPTFMQVLGMCPTLAVTTTVSNGIGMGISTTFVLVMSNLVIALIKNIIPSKIRIAAYVVVIAGFVSIVDMCLKAYLPQLAEVLGIFIPLIVVNCIILARAESFASKNKCIPSILDGVFMGLGFTLALVLISLVRELLGAGTLFGIPVFGESFRPVMMMAMAPGGFITLGLLMATVRRMEN